MSAGLRMPTIQQGAKCSTVRSRLQLQQSPMLAQPHLDGVFGLQRVGVWVSGDEQHLRRLGGMEGSMRSTAGNGGGQ